MSFLISAQVFGQDSTMVSRVISRMGDIHRSTESTYFFSVDSIPKPVLQQMFECAQQTKDGSITLENFIANRGEYWEPGCGVLVTTAPTRQFLFGQRNGQEVIFAYWHGGFGTHVHLVYGRLDKPTIISSFTTLRNVSMFDDLELEDNPIPASIQLEVPLVEPGGLRVLDNVSYERGDLF